MPSPHDEQLACLKSAPAKSVLAWSWII